MAKDRRTSAAIAESPLATAPAGIDGIESAAAGTSLSYKAPLILTGAGRSAELQDIYRGASAFLICGGPSLTSHNLALLEQRGILTLAVNNAATVIRPNIWCSVDDPGHFSDVIWRDPGILKFVPHSHFDKSFLVRNEDDLLVPSGRRIGEMPAVFGFQRNDAFHADRWLYEETFNWGNRGDRVDAFGQKGSRSVMYVALRLLFYLGVRRIFLLGCDFRMELGKSNYAFEQERTISSVRGNNSSYKILNVRLQHLKPHFEAAGLDVWNCTPDSGLTVFPFRSFEQAVAEAIADIPRKILTRGMYDRADVAGNARGIKRPRVVATKLQGEFPIVRPTSTVPGKIAASDVTVMLVSGAASLPALRRTWRAWHRVQGGRSLPVLLVVDARLGTCREQFSFLAADSKASVVAVDSPAKVLVRDIVEVVRTPWCLRIDARDLERSAFQLPDLSRVDAQTRLYCSSEVPASSSAEVMTTLDRWWNRGRRKSANTSVQPVERHVPPAHPLLVHSGWLQSIFRESPDNCPGLTDEVLLRYCARRTGVAIGSLSAPGAQPDPCVLLDPTLPQAFQLSADSRKTAPTDLPAAGAKECNEFRALQRRGFKDYSVGHRRMYTSPISLIQTKNKRYRILDVGCGIGFGLQQMLKADVVESYVGVEPVQESFEYIREQFGKLPNVRLLNQDWLQVRAESLEPADYVFCIEVVEHLAPQMVLPFLKRLALFTKKNLFLSTPDRTFSKHGTRSTEEWQASLAQVGLNSVAVGSQWTTLFICERKK